MVQFGNILKLPCIFFVLSTISCAKGEKEEIISFSKTLMGTEVRIKVCAKDDQNLRNAIEATYTEGERLNTIFSDYEAQSEVSRFSKTSGSGKFFALSEELFEVLEYSQNLSRQSNGAFDVTVGPLSRLWRVARFQKRLPDEKKLAEAIKRSGFENLILKSSSRMGKLKLPAMVIDLGGIAKGFVTDRMLEKMKSMGYSKCLIDAGGDLTIGDAPIKRSGWKVSIGGQKHPDLPILELTNCAVATSGDIEQFLEISGTRYSHLIDPKTGYGLTNRFQVTVIAANGMIADSVASTSLAIGIEHSKEFLKQNEIEALYFVLDKNAKLQLEVLEIKE